MMLQNIEMQIVSTIGALLCLYAYIGHQMHWLDSRKPWFNTLNILGSGFLVYAALHPLQIGFLLMEVTWTIISVYGLHKSFRGIKK